MAKGHKSTNEQEFQSRVAIWLDSEVKRSHKGRLDQATSEKPNQSSGKRNDLVVWESRQATKGFLTLELKTPTTPLSDPVFFQDALSKAQKWRAPIFCIWNIQRAELYITPADGAAPPISPFASFDSPVQIKSVEDWIAPQAAEALEVMARRILDAAVMKVAHGEEFSVGFDSEVFVHRLEEAIATLRSTLHVDLQAQIKANKKARGRINAIAAAQGFAGFVEDIELALAGQFAYRLAGQILFYYALRRKNSALPVLQPDRKLPLAPQLRVCWDMVRRFDYEALYGVDELETLLPPSNDAEQLLHKLIEMLAHYDWAALADDVLGAVFERLIPREEQILLGQFYTPKPVADFLVGLVVDGASPLVLDPGCGSGTFLMSAYDYHAKVQKNSHSEILSKVWGFDLSPFATELASINLYRQDLGSFDNFPRIVPGSFFDRSLGEKIEFPPPKPPAGQVQKLKVPIPEFDAIVANPPYLRSQNQDDLDPAYRAVLFSSAVRMGLEAPPKTDLFAFFLFHGYQFLRPGARLGFVTPASWLSSDYGTLVQEFLLTKLRLIAIVSSEAESLFSQVDVNTILLVAERPEEGKAYDAAKFVTLKKPLAEIFPAGVDYWTSILNVTSALEATQADVENVDYRVKVLSTNQSLDKDVLKVGQNWSAYLRAPLTYFEIFGQSGRSAPLGEFAHIGIGFKSLQNDFFYVAEETAATYGIEAKYLNPIFTLRDFESGKFLQTPQSSQMVFTCTDDETDLKGTGALKYIRTMGNRAANKKKQTGAVQKISEVLAKQGGKLWYAPKAAQNASNIWLRKAMGGVFAPYICESEVVVDQRCNFALAKGISSEELAAVLTSTVFAFAVEINGSISMGGGVLEAPTSKLREYPLPDITKWTDAQRKELVRYAKAVWKGEAPLDWSSGDVPGSALKKLDDHVLACLGCAVTALDLYRDLRSAVDVRYRLASDKTGKQSKKKSEGLSSVAEAVANKVRPLQEARLFPEGLVASTAALEQFDSLGKRIAVIELHPLMGHADVIIEFADGESVSYSWPLHVAEIVVRAILLGRRKFEFPSSSTIAGSILDDAHSWIEEIKQLLDETIEASAAGSHYEDAVRQSALSTLGICEEAFLKILPPRITL